MSWMMLDDTALMTRHKEALFQWWKGASIAFDLQVRGVLCSPEALLGTSSVTWATYRWMVRSEIRRENQLRLVVKTSHYLRDSFNIPKGGCSGCMSESSTSSCMPRPMAMAMAASFQHDVCCDPQMSSDAVASRHITLQAKPVFFGIRHCWWQPEIPKANHLLDLVNDGIFTTNLNWFAGFLPSTVLWYWLYMCFVVVVWIELLDIIGVIKESQMEQVTSTGLCSQAWCNMIRWYCEWKHPANQFILGKHI